MQRRRRKVHSEDNYKKLKCAESAFFYLRLNNSCLCNFSPTYVKPIDITFGNSIMSKIGIIYNI